MSVQGLNERIAAHLNTLASTVRAKQQRQQAKDEARRRARQLRRRLDRGFIRLTSVDPDLSFFVRLGEGGADLKGGFGGWAEVTRPRRIAFTEWDGLSPYRMSVPVLFDGFLDDESIESDIRKLERMAIPFPRTGKPPIINIEGAVPKTDLTWVIESIEWGDSIRVPDHRGNLDRQRAAVTINFLHYESSDTSIEIRGGSASKNQQKSKAKTVKIYVVKSGDTLTKIAASKLGSASKWKEIARLNGIRDPDRIHVGQRLKLP